MAGLKQHISRGISSARFGDAEELAHTVLFLALDELSNINATDIAVEGGAVGVPIFLA